MPSPSEAGPLVLSGRPASAGRAAGAVWRPPETAARGRRPLASPVRSLDEAIATVRAALSALRLQAGGDGPGAATDLLDVHDEMLADTVWRDAAMRSVMQGADPRAAWRGVLDAEIQAYAASPDPDFAARAADIADLRDRVLAALDGGDGTAADPIPSGAIYLAEEIGLARFLAHDWTGGGIALHGGSERGHVAVLARQRGVPMLVGVERRGRPDGSAVLDASAGRLIVGAGVPARAGEARRGPSGPPRERAGAVRTADGTPVRLLCSVADDTDLAALDGVSCDGIGLVRTEFSFGGRIADEERQRAFYGRLLDWADGRPVVVRAFDAGGDKPVDGLSAGADALSPGMRGIRLLLSRPGIFRIQIRALLRAAVRPGLSVILPMVSTPDELDAALAIIAGEARALAQAGIPHGVPPVGIMAEVPAVALTPERFARAASFAIGSNDLAHHVLAISRDAGPSAALPRGYDPAGDPAVVALVAACVARAGTLGIPVSLCGDAAADPALIPVWLEAGLRALVVPPVALARTAAIIGATVLEHRKPERSEA